MFHYAVYLVAMERQKHCFNFNDRPRGFSLGGLRYPLGSSARGNSFFYIQKRPTIMSLSLFEILYRSALLQPTSQILQASHYERVSEKDFLLPSRKTRDSLQV